MIYPNNDPKKDLWLTEQCCLHVLWASNLFFFFFCHSDAIIKRSSRQEAHGPRVAHLSDIATADMQMLCNIFPILSSQLLKRSSFKQFLILKKNIYGMPVNRAWSFEQTLNGGHGFTICTILAIFDLRVIPMLPPNFRVNWSFSSGEEAKNRFSRWLPWWPSWISDWHDFSYFWSTNHPNVSYQVWSQWPFGAGEEAKYRFSRSRSSGGHQNDFSYFWSTSQPSASC